jgi:predicted RNase H-like nuclease (RuvC/YqgF family)
MQRVFLTIFAIALLMSLAAYGQSLADIARENREKKSQAASAAQPKMITNANLPKHTDANPEPSESEGPMDEAPSGASAAASSKAADHRSAQQHLAEQRAADQWKRQILAQKNKMATLQARIDQLNASIRSAGGSVQYEEPYSRYQARQLQRVAQIQQQLDEQKMKLDQMQEAARHAGMHTAVYDP